MKRRGLNDLTNWPKNNNRQLNDDPPPGEKDRCQPTKTNVDKQRKGIMKKVVKADFYFLNEYSNEIFLYLLDREIALFIDRKAIISFDPTRRINVIMWFISLANKINISNDCIHLAIALFDRYHQLADQIDYVYTGIIILWIASKIEDSFPISLKEIIKQTNFPFETEIKARCVKLEIEVLKTLDFHVNIPTPIQFLRHFTKIAKTNEVCHQTAKFIVDLTLTDCRFIGLHYSLIAASGFCIAADLVKHVPEMGDSWNAALRRYSSFDKFHLLPIMKEMINLLVNTNKILKPLLPLYRRYSKTVDSNHLSRECMRNYQYKMPSISDQ